MSALPNLRQEAWFAALPVQRIFAVLNRDGDEGRVVGGAVRDSLMHRPVSEVDFATTAVPQVVTARAEAAGIKVVPTGIDHGTVTLVVAGKGHEVTTLREDVETDGRHAVVRFGTDWRADAERRDFTINALSATADGTVHDPVGGFDDVVARRVRFIGDPDRRIAEDRLRLLRFFRFHAECGEGPLDRAGLGAAIRARRDVLGLAAERLNREFRRLVMAPGAAETIRAMQDAGILPVLLGGIGYPARLAKLVQFEASAELAPAFPRRLAALAAAIVEDGERVAARFKLSNADREALLAGVRNAGRWPAPPGTGEAKRAAYRLGPAVFTDALALSAIDRRGGLERWAAALAPVKGWAVPEFPLSGKDLLGLGMARGPQLGVLLRELEAWWIDQGFMPDRDMLMSRVQQMRAAQQ